MRNVARPVRFMRLPSLLGAVALAATAMILSGCEVTETTQTYRSGPMCPQIYDPVCAERRGDERTFPNACEARVAGWRIVADGQCRADYYRDRDYRRDSGRDRYDKQRTKDRRPVPPAAPVQPAPPVRQSTPVQPVVPDSVCPQGGAPVCGQTGDQVQWFKNSCEMLRAGAVGTDAGYCYGNMR